MDNLRDFMDSMIKNDWDTFTKFICNIQHTNDQMNITEILKNMEKKDLEIIWKEINSKCTQILQEDYSCRPDIYQLLKAISLLALKSVHLKLDDQNFFDTVSLLCNTILMPSTGGGGDDDDDLKSLVSSVCESLWKDSVDGVEELIPNVVQYLMERCLLPQPKMTFVTRLHAIRNAIPRFGLPSEIDRHRLLEVFSDGNFLKIRRKLGALIFCLSVDFAREVHACLKKLIITSSKSSLSWISQVYFDAWKLAKDSGMQELVECIELDCLSDVIFVAIHSPRNSNDQFVKFFKVLSHFHKDKSSKVVSGLLCKLYGGILFRSLKAPNGMVRANAMFILSDVFPLCDLNKGQEFNEDLLHQQLKEYENLMEDTNIKARQATVAGMFGIFNNYWQLIPLDKRKSLIMKMMQFCAWDATSSEVRLCVVRGFTILLDNFLACHALKNILPTLTNMVHDLNDKVRLAMVDLLLKVKEARDLKFWQIVPMNHLLARLEEESNKVIIRKIVNLLSDSYAPPTATLPVQLKRCIKLFQANWIAARKFYSELAHSLEVMHGCKLIVYILEKLSNQTLESLASNVAVDDVEMNENDQSQTTSMQLADIDLVTSLSEAVYFLSVGMKTTLKMTENDKVSKVLIKQISKLVPSILRTYQNVHVVTNPLMLMCGHYNPKIFPSLSCSIVSKLSNIPEPTSSNILQLEASLASQFSLDESLITYMNVLLEVACKWKRAKDVLNLCGEWIESVFKQSGPIKPRPKGVNFNVPDVPKPLLGMLFVRLMLQNKSCRSIIIECHSDQLARINNILAQVMVAIGDEVRRVPALLLVGSLRTCLVIEVLLHKDAVGSTEENSACNAFERCFAMLTSKLQNNATMHNMSDDDDDDEILLRNILEVVMKLTISVLKLDVLTSSSSLASLTNLCSATLQSSILTRNMFANILEIVAILSRHCHHGIDFKMLSNLLNSLFVLSQLDNFKDVLKQMKPKVLALFVALIGGGDDDDGSPNDEIKQIIDSIVFLGIRSASDAIVQGNIPIKICDGGGDDDGGGDNDDDVHHYEATGVYCLDLIFEIMGHKDIKNGIFLNQWLKCCELNDSESVEDVAGLFFCISRMVKNEKYKGELADKCYELFRSKCCKMLDHVKHESEIVKWLKTKC